MSAFSFSFTLTRLAALSAIAIVAACGDGNGGSSPAAMPESTRADAGDAADQPTLEAATAAYAAVDQQVRERGLPGLREKHVAKDENGALRAGRFPGLKQTNLVANNGNYGAAMVEPALQNAWGIAIRPAGFGGHFWVGASHTGQSIQYVGDVGDQPLFQDELKIVATLGPVTGVAFNPGTAGFEITQPHANGAITASAKFFFANLSGTITGWTERKRADGGFDHPLDSVIVVDGSASRSAFFGVTMTPAADRMLAADFGADPDVRRFDGQFAEQAPLSNPFRPSGEKEPAGFEAFNVQTLGDRTFAMYGRHVVPDPNVPLPTEGRLAEFDGDGKLVARWYGRGYLNYPWGVAYAPDSFGLYAGCLLVGNFGDGRMVAFHPRYRVAIDYVRDTRGDPIVVDGLWGLQFGNGASLGEADHLYFAAGPNKEADGLFGKFQVNPDTLRYLTGISLCR